MFLHLPWNKPSINKYLPPSLYLPIQQNLPSIYLLSNEKNMKKNRQPWMGPGWRNHLQLSQVVSQDLNYFYAPWRRPESRLCQQLLDHFRKRSLYIFYKYIYVFICATCMYIYVTCGYLYIFIYVTFNYTLILCDHIHLYSQSGWFSFFQGSQTTSFTNLRPWCQSLAVKGFWMRRYLSLASKAYWIFV